MSSLSLLCVVALFLTQVVSPAKILVYNPLFAQSHVNYMAAIGRILTEEGHLVTTLAPLSDSSIRFDPAKFTKTIFVPMPNEVKHALSLAMEGWDFWQYDSYNITQMTNVFTKNGNFMAASCRALLAQKEIIEELQRENFDVAITEHLDTCGTGLFHILNIENTILSPSMYFTNFQLEHFGIPSATSYVPTFDSGISADELANSWWARLKNAYLYFVHRYAQHHFFNAVQSVFDELVPDFPQLSALAAQSSLIFVNTNPLLDFPRPTFYKVINIGGVHLDAPKRTVENISEEWSEILSRRQRNVLISFGSMAQSALMPAANKAAFVEMARRLSDVTFIWKYEMPDDEVGRGITNLVKVAWTPQPELLQSGRLTAFLTHGGMGSVNEAVHTGVPLLLVGLFADQMRNAAMTAAHGGAIALDKWQLDSADYLTNAMMTLLENSSYTENAKRLAGQLNALPFSSRELLVRHTEFVARHGPLQQLTPVSTKMNFLQTHFIDLISLALTIAIALISILAVSAAYLASWFDRPPLRLKNKRE